jgi:hypothetical protein
MAVQPLADRPKPLPKRRPTVPAVGNSKNSSKRKRTIGGESKSGRPMAKVQPLAENPKVNTTKAAPPAPATQQVPQPLATRPTHPPKRSGDVACPDGWKTTAAVTRMQPRATRLYLISRRDRFAPAIGGGISINMQLHLQALRCHHGTTFGLKELTSENADGRGFVAALNFEAITRRYDLLERTPGANLAIAQPAPRLRLGDRGAHGCFKVR